MKSFKQFLKDGDRPSRAKTVAKRVAAVLAKGESVREVDELIIDRGADGGLQRLDEGKWLSVEFENDIRVDRNTHMRTGEKHFHFHDRKGNETHAMTADGKPSHGSKPFQLSKDHAKAIRKEGGKVPASRIVEAVLIGKTRVLLLG